MRTISPGLTATRVLSFSSPSSATSLPQIASQPGLTSTLPGALAGSALLAEPAKALLQQIAEGLTELAAQEIARLAALCGVWLGSRAIGLARIAGFARLGILRLLRIAGLATLGFARFRFRSVGLLGFARLAGLRIARILGIAGLDALGEGSVAARLTIQVPDIPDLISPNGVGQGPALSLRLMPQPPRVSEPPPSPVLPGTSEPETTPTGPAPRAGPLPFGPAHDPGGSAGQPDPSHPTVAPSETTVQPLGTSPSGPPPCR